MGWLLVLTLSVPAQAVPCVDATDCDDGNVCTTDTCPILTQVCQYTNNTKPCNDGNACTTSDTCSAGVCVGGAPPNCDDGNVCTNDSCSPATGCVHANNTAPCNDGSVCTTNDICSGGACVGGTALNCDDGNVCTTETCDPATGCVHTNNTAPCNDGNACTTNDTCSGGTCVGGAAPNCDDGNVCTDDACNPATGCTHTNNTAPCNDGSVCTTNDACSGGACVGGAALNCDDGNVCTTDTCDPATGCVHANNNAPCNDGNACTTNDTCSGGACAGGPAPNCDDGNVCTDDACAPATGCTHANNTASCNDGNACTTNDTCSAGLCIGGAAPNCDDGNVCTDDSCNPATGCTHTNNAAPCNDGNVCTTNDTCAGGACVGGAAPNCDDGNVCTNDSCNPSSGCVHTNNQLPCDDGNVCTINDHCSQGACTGGTPRNCGDGNDCTDDTCNPATGCVHTNNTAPCSDGNACTTRDVCVNGVCVGGQPTSCDDGNVCTDDSCDPVIGCLHVDNSARCDDGNPCTDDSCHILDGCIHTKNVAACNDGSACTVGDTCVNGVCRSGSPVDCTGAGGPCNSVFCDPNGTEGNCAIVIHLADGTVCNDGDHCTVVEKCLNGACVEDVPAADDPYRCVRLEWRASGPANYYAGDTAGLSLYAVADGCNTPSLDCPTDGHAIEEIDVILDWDPAYLQLQPAATGDPNPADPCDNADCGVVCPPDEYNWLNSVFPSDCGADSLNQPCGAFPANDGDALYVASSYAACNGPTARAACASPAGLHVTTFQFKVLAMPPGGTTPVAMTPCTGNFSKSKVRSRVPRPPGYQTSDVTKSLGPAVAVSVHPSCVNNAECTDSDPCTTDSCVNGVCRHTPLICPPDSDPCTVDACVGGVCTHTPVSCGVGEVCYIELGGCYKPCATVADCNDGIACTVDTCDTSPPPPIDGVCHNTPNDALCDTGLFCSVKRCDAELGCVFDGQCIPGNADGNPCPNPATCDEDTNTCGGCNPPAAVAAGSRYLAVTPASQGATPVALLVKGDCDDPAAACVYQYVQSKCNGGANNGQNCMTDVDCPKRCAGGLNPGAVCTSSGDCVLGTCAGKCEAGTLGGTPFYKTASQWGTAKVRGAQIRPGADYLVEAQCDFPGVVLSVATTARTWKWGDIDGDGDVDALDIAQIVDAFKARVGSVPFEQANIWGCAPDTFLDALDITEDVDAFKGVAFPCGITCP
jgi:hypothetical protein